MNTQTIIAFLIGAFSILIVLGVVVQRWMVYQKEKTARLIKAAEESIRASAYELAAAEDPRIQQRYLEKEAEFERKRAELELKSLEQAEHQHRLDAKQQFLEDRMMAVDRLEAEGKRKRLNVENLRELCRKRLEQIAHMTEAEAQEILKQEIREEQQKEFVQIRESYLQKTEEELQHEARRVIMSSMQRLSAMPSTDITAAVVRLPHDDMKGRIIGREGRNIKSFETATGTTLVIDETPETVMVSSFDPVKRDVARIALENLVKDGRIHPASIEDAVVKAQEELEYMVKQLGQGAVEKLDMHDVPAEIISLLGKLNYRLSNNQNTLEHSIEVAYFMSMMASELSLDPKIAKRCGLFHDIGKSMPYDMEGSHALVASKLLKKYGEDPIVINAVAAHHEEVPVESIYGHLLMLADSISAKRPGARSECLSGYVQRIKSLEELAKSFTGVADAYAVQAGRELRVIIAPQYNNDLEAKRLAFRIKQKIENDISYPGNIKVTVIREQRYTETAKQQNAIKSAAELDKEGFSQEI